MQMHRSILGGRGWGLKFWTPIFGVGGRTPTERTDPHFIVPPVTNFISTPSQKFCLVPHFSDQSYQSYANVQMSCQSRKWKLVIGRWPRYGPNCPLLRKQSFSFGTSEGRKPSWNRLIAGSPVWKTTTLVTVRHWLYDKTLKMTCNDFFTKLIKSNF